MILITGQHERAHQRHLALRQSPPRSRIAAGSRAQAAGGNSRDSRTDPRRHQMRRQQPRIGSSRCAPAQREQRPRHAQPPHPPAARPPSIAPAPRRPVPHHAPVGACAGAASLSPPTADPNCNASLDGATCTCTNARAGCNLPRGELACLDDDRRQPPARALRARRRHLRHRHAWRRRRSFPPDARPHGDRRRQAAPAPARRASPRGGRRRVRHGLPLDHHRARALPLRHQPRRRPAQVSVTVGGRGCPATPGAPTAGTGPPCRRARSCCSGRPARASQRAGGAVCRSGTAAAGRRAQVASATSIARITSSVSFGTTARAPRFSSTARRGSRRDHRADAGVLEAPRDRNAARGARRRRRPPSRGGLTTARRDGSVSSGAATPSRERRARPLGHAVVVRR